MSGYTEIALLQYELEKLRARVAELGNPASGLPSLRGSGARRYVKNCGTLTDTQVKTLIGVPEQITAPQPSVQWEMNDGLRNSARNDAGRSDRRVCNSFYGVAMTDNRICAATPRQSLEDQILNENEPKNEREWWACRHIKYLRDEVIAERNVDIEQLRQRVTEKDEVIAEAGEMLAMRDRQLAAIKADNATAWAQAHRLALELECLLLDTKDNAIVSKWWDSGMEALNEYQELQPEAAESAEALAKMRKAGL